MDLPFLAFAVLSFLGLGAEKVDFDMLAPKAAPPDWSIAHTHSGPPGDWIVHRDPSAPSRPNVLSQMSHAGSRFEFEIAVFDKVTCRDGDLSAKIRLPSGSGSKTAGLIWRYQDPNNFYMLHLSADQRNVVLFRVQDGKAEEIPAKGAKPGSFGVSHDVRPGVWYLARVVYRGPRIRVFLGNRLLFDATDSVISQAGKTGIWTKGSTVASFDDFRIDKKN
jgi:hypothetical protein